MIGWPNYMSRGWVPLDEFDPIWENDDYYDSIAEEASYLADAWSVIKNNREEATFRSIDNDRDIEPEEEAIYLSRANARRLLDEAQINAIEERLNELKVRLMRPYEHWNEDEKYMEWM